VPRTEVKVSDELAADGRALASIATDSTPGLDGGKSAAKKADKTLTKRLGRLQGKLFAQGRTGGTRSALIVLQGMDCSGKSGAIRSIAHRTNPLGLRVAPFNKPTDEERRHDFLWRIRKRLPGPGELVVFDRSHYEDVVAGPVRDGLSPEAVKERYEAINALERELVESGTLVLKCFLHISQDEQRKRLLSRLGKRRKVWKFNPSDIEDRNLWEDFTAAYDRAIGACQEAAPWYVIPADRKWYRDWAMTTLLIEGLKDMELDWPEPDFDVDAARRALRE
jgi:PPK2 family polyphosphate:nucleotide phosphotransferase